MSKNYILLANGNFVGEDELFHHGVKGQKWGVRRYQNKDGSLTAAGKKRLKDNTTDLSENDRQQIDKITKGFTKPSYSVGDKKYYEFKSKIAGTDVNVTVGSPKGKENDTAVEAVKFLKKYDLNKAKTGVVKEFYDGKYSWIDKEPGGENYYSRKDFESKVKLESIVIHPNINTYEAYWSAGDTYYGHWFNDRGNLDNMKVRERTLVG